MLFEVIANAVILGTYEADTESQACDLCAQDAGYKGVDDMVAQLEHASCLEARLVTEEEARR